MQRGDTALGGLKLGPLCQTLSNVDCPLYCHHPTHAPLPGSAGSGWSFSTVPWTLCSLPSPVALPSYTNTFCAVTHGYHSFSPPFSLLSCVLSHHTTLEWGREGHLLRPEPPEEVLKMSRVELSWRPERRRCVKALDSPLCSRRIG